MMSGDMKDVDRSLKSLLELIGAQEPTLEYCEEMGRDCALNGANTTNCNFRLFRSPEHTKAWERGKKSVKVQ